MTSKDVSDSHAYCDVVSVVDACACDSEAD